ncbi:MULTISPECIES: hypothetical protein [Sphingobacterium]|uniref:hypothetical protein n=1 Tax=Sphingobacterium TaxID=28453 RepID=UPI0013DAA24D|nr:MULTISPECIES: hypothetical protein [unclassified Sphingobacterium]
MNCESINPFVASCGEDLRAGTKAVYILAYKDAEKVTGSTKIYAESATGVINEIGLKETKKFAKVDFHSKSEAITETASMGENGILTETATFAGVINGFNKESLALVKSLLGQDVIILAELGSGKYSVIGVDGGFKLTEAVGTHNATDSNRALSFAGDVYGGVKEVDGTIVPTLI